MTDRYAGFIVILDDDYRDDSGGAELLNAIRMLKGVISVEPVVSSYEFHVARARRDARWAARLRELACGGPDAPEVS